jgi:uncharacterized membrane protein
VFVVVIDFPGQVTIREWRAMSPTAENSRELAASHIRLGSTAAVGLIAGGVVALWVSTVQAVLVGWDALAATYLAWAWIVTWRWDAPATARLAGREDPGRGVSDVLMLAAAVASLAGVGLVITSSGSASITAKDVAAGLAVISVVLSWGLLHTIYTERYARLYYTEPTGGIDFNESTPPRYADFAYLAFTVGMTFQVSDTDLTRQPIRATVLRHALLSYLFGTVIIASTINLLVGLAK